MNSRATIYQDLRIPTNVGTSPKEGKQTKYLPFANIVHSQTSLNWQALDIIESPTRE
jgi:hypothetical protein